MSTSKSQVQDAVNASTPYVPPKPTVGYVQQYKIHTLMEDTTISNSKKERIMTIWQSFELSKKIQQEWTRISKSRPDGLVLQAVRQAFLAKYSQFNQDYPSHMAAITNVKGGLTPEMFDQSRNACIYGILSGSVKEYKNKRTEVSLRHFLPPDVQTPPKEVYALEKE